MQPTIAAYVRTTGDSVESKRSSHAAGACIGVCGAFGEYHRKSERLGREVPCSSMIRAASAAKRSVAYPCSLTRSPLRDHDLWWL